LGAQATAEDSRDAGDPAVEKQQHDGSDADQRATDQPADYVGVSHLSSSLS
jgi:hypothetical protein